MIKLFTDLFYLKCRSKHPIFKEIASKCFPSDNYKVVKQLESKEEIEWATKCLSRLRVNGHHDPVKNWDLLLTLANATKLSNKENVLDAGAGSKSAGAATLRYFGFKNLHACDLQTISAKGVKSVVCDLTKTPYFDNQFGLVICLSVVEHGINLADFSKEMFRITKNGGSLIISTDFWPRYEDYSDRFPYGHEQPPMKLFNNETLKQFLVELRKAGWSIPKFEPLEELESRPVTWERMGASYTFVWFKVEKPNL